MLHYLFINIHVHSAYMVVTLLSHCNLNTSLKGICFLLLLPGDDLPPHVNYATCRTLVPRSSTSPVVPRGRHCRCSRPPSDLLDVPPWKHPTTRRCPCSSIHPTSKRAYMVSLECPPCMCRAIVADHSGIISTA